MTGLNDLGDNQSSKQTKLLDSLRKLSGIYASAIQLSVDRYESRQKNDAPAQQTALDSADEYIGRLSRLITLHRQLGGH